MTSHGLTSLAVAAVVAVLSGAPAARAESPLDTMPAVRNKVLMHEDRHAVTPIFGFTINDPYQQNLLGGLSWRWFIQSWLAIGVDVLGGGSVETDLAGQINKDLSLAGDPKLSTTSLRLLLDATAEVIPIEGKFMLFDDFLVRLDLHVQFGIGMALVAGDGRLSDSVSVMPMFGFGMRFFGNEWIGVGFDVRDYVIDRVLASDRKGAIPASEFGHNWFVGFNLTLMFPDEPEIRP